MSAFNRGPVILDSQHRVRVLVVDDDPQMRNLLVAFLRRDYIVAVAKDGEEAFQKASEHAPDVLLVDIQMPGWDGIRTLQAFRGHPLLKSVRAIVLTADSSRQTVMAAIQAGASDYVVKSVMNKDSLLKKIAVASATPVPKFFAHLTSDDRDHQTEAGQPTFQPAAPMGIPTESNETKLQEMVENWE